MDPLATELILAELRKLSAKQSELFADLTAVCVKLAPTPSATVSPMPAPSIAADNWGGLFGGGNHSGELLCEAPILADNWGGLFEQPAHDPEERGVFGSAQIRNEPAFFDSASPLPMAEPLAVDAAATAYTSIDLAVPPTLFLEEPHADGSEESGERKPASLPEGAPTSILRQNSTEHSPAAVEFSCLTTKEGKLIVEHEKLQIEAQSFSLMVPFELDGHAPLHPPPLCLPRRAPSLRLPRRSSPRPSQLRGPRRTSPRRHGRRSWRPPWLCRPRLSRLSGPRRHGRRPWRAPLRPPWTCPDPPPPSRSCARARHHAAALTLLQLDAAPTLPFSTPRDASSKVRATAVSKSGSQSDHAVRVFDEMWIKPDEKLVSAMAELASGMTPQEVYFSSSGVERSTLELFLLPAVLMKHESRDGAVCREFVLLPVYSYRLHQSCIITCIEFQPWLPPVQSEGKFVQNLVQLRQPWPTPGQFEQSEGDLFRCVLSDFAVDWKYLKIPVRFNVIPWVHGMSLLGSVVVNTPMLSYNISGKFAPLKPVSLGGSELLVFIQEAFTLLKLYVPNMYCMASHHRALPDASIHVSLMELYVILRPVWSGLMDSQYAVIARQSAVVPLWYVSIQQQLGCVLAAFRESWNWLVRPRTLVVFPVPLGKSWLDTEVMTASVLSKLKNTSLEISQTNSANLAIWFNSIQSNLHYSCMELMACIALNFLSCFSNMMIPEMQSGSYMVLIQEKAQQKCGGLLCYQSLLPLAREQFVQMKPFFDISTMLLHQMLLQPSVLQHPTIGEISHQHVSLTFRDGVTQWASQWPSYYCSRADRSPRSFLLLITIWPVEKKRQWLGSGVVLKVQRLCDQIAFHGGLCSRLDLLDTSLSFHWDPDGAKLLHRLEDKPKLKKGGMSVYTLGLLTAAAHMELMMVSVISVISCSLCQSTVPFFHCVSCQDCWKLWLEFHQKAVKVGRNDIKFSSMLLLGAGQWDMILSRAYMFKRKLLVEDEHLMVTVTSNMQLQSQCCTLEVAKIHADMQAGFLVSFCPTHRRTYSMIVITSINLVDWKIKRGLSATQAWCADRLLLIKDLQVPWDPGGTEILHRLGGKPKLKKGGMLATTHGWALGLGPRPSWVVAWTTGHLLQERLEAAREGDQTNYKQTNRLLTR